MMRRQVQVNLTIWLVIVVIVFVAVMASVAYMTRDDAEMERLQRMETLSNMDG